MVPEQEKGGIGNDIQSAASTAANAAKDAKTVAATAAKAAAGDYVGAAVEVAKNPGIIGKILAMGCLGQFIGIIMFIGFIIFLVAAPLNAIYFGAEASGSAITKYVDKVGQDLQVGWYSFMEGMFVLGDDVKEFAADLFHPIQAAERERIESQIAGLGLPTATDDQFQEYCDTTNSVVVLLEGAFKSGWAKTLATAKVRAEKIKQKGENIVDTMDNTILFDNDKFWGNTSNWNPNNKSDRYKAGTHPGGAIEYRGGYTGDATNYVLKYVSDDIIKPSYMRAILQIITLQNLSEQSVVLNDNRHDNQYGITTDYAGEDTELTPAQKKATEYQLLKLASKIAGKGVMVGELGTEKETESIYEIIIKPIINETLHEATVERKEIIGYEQVPFYQTHLVPDGMGGWVEMIKYDDDGNPIIIGYSDGDPIYGWFYDHTDVWVTVTATVNYSVELKNESKEIMKTAITKDYTEKEKRAYNEAEISFYNTNYETLCKMYNITDGWEGDIDGSGFVADEGYFSWPLPQDVGFWSRGFAYNSGGKIGHGGLDWAAPEGTAIFAPADGVVVNAKYQHNWGNHVVLKHDNGTQTNYAHMVQYLVTPGQTVKRGDIIGLVGNTGNSQGNHLHLELWHGTSYGNRVDPEPSFAVPPHGDDLYSRYD